MTQKDPRREFAPRAFEVDSLAVDFYHSALTDGVMTPGSTALAYRVGTELGTISQLPDRFLPLSH